MLFYVDKTYEAENWVKHDTSIDCATTQTCASGTVHGRQTCTTWTLGGDIKAEVNIVKDFLTVGGAINGNGGGVKCSTADSTNTCTWNDKGCHAVWTSNVNLVNHGYVRRRCHDKGADYTAWSFDFDVKVPEDQTRIGCAASCSMTTYPDPVPPAQ
ncbi:hypothetical protein GP486_002552 [Trichoglossum hirsutum]|uniref:Uncharacterized protein n=1 Tax=Trichoglossum hirsutum TaxID=265104 RepID=A0A9P8LEU6_9PEZI|nr:hypothetical protein GP486_002552 [Trichoglossum hirsutum]